MRRVREIKGAVLMSSDGLPNHYYDVVSDPFAMRAMKDQIHRLLDLDNTLTVEDIFTLTDINQIFYSEVEEFYKEWWENERSRKNHDQTIRKP